MTSLVASVVENQRALAESRGRRWNVRRAPRGQSPRGIERAYRAAMQRILVAVRDDIREVIVPEIPRLLRAAGHMDSMRVDVEDIEASLATGSQTLTARVNNRHLRDLEVLVSQYGAETSTRHRQELIRQIRSMIGVDAFPIAGAAEATALNGFVVANRKAIIGLTTEYVSQVEDIVRRGVQAGDRAVLLQKQIEGRFGMFTRRSALIARDQVNKLNGNLAKARQTSLGVEKYVWRTSRDERVRESHLVKEGRVYAWNDPPADTGHPGQDYQCRCTAEPYIPGASPPSEDRRAVIREVRAQRERLRGELGARRRGRAR